MTIDLTKKIESQPKGLLCNSKIGEYHTLYHNFYLDLNMLKVQMKLYAISKITKNLKIASIFALLVIFIHYKSFVIELPIELDSLLFDLFSLPTKYDT